MEKYTPLNINGKFITPTDRRYNELYYKHLFKNKQTFDKIEPITNYGDYGLSGIINNDDVMKNTNDAYKLLNTNDQFNRK